jgi:hypothetical protein
MIFIFLAIMAIIFVMELSINDDNKELDMVSTTNENEVTSKEIKVLSLSIKDEDVTIICDSNYKILIHKNQGNHKYNCEVSKGSEKLNGVKIYGFHELLESVDKIKSKSHKVKVTFDFSESNGDLNNIHFKSIPNDFEIDY